MPLIEKIARRMCTMMQEDPDEIVTIGLTPNRRSYPRWKLNQEWALRCLAFQEVMEAEQSSNA